MGEWNLDGDLRATGWVSLTFIITFFSFILRLSWAGTNGILEMWIWESSFVFKLQPAILWGLDTMKVGAEWQRNTWGCCLEWGSVVEHHDRKIPFNSHNGAILHLSCPNESPNLQQLNTMASSLACKPVSCKPYSALRSMFQILCQPRLSSASPSDYWRGGCLYPL